MKLGKVFFALGVFVGFSNLYGQHAERRQRVFKESVEIESRSTSSLVVVPFDNISVLTALQLGLFGNGVAVTNLSYEGRYESGGVFQEPTSAFGINEGLVLTTGLAVKSIGPNDVQHESSEDLFSLDSIMASSVDSDLAALCDGDSLYDALTIEFDFVSDKDTIFVSTFVFGSEEYPEYVDEGYNDVFGFFISGPGINGTENLALVPSSNDPISVDNVNDNLNSDYYIENEDTLTSVLQYDGYTKPITLSKEITAGVTYHFKIAIADVGDGIYDSGVFIKEGSFTTDNPLVSGTTTDTTLVSGIEGSSSEESSISFYPNPTQNGIFYDGVGSISNAKIFSLFGGFVTEVFISNDNYIDLSMLDNGVYIIETINGNKKEHNKIVIQK